MLKCHNIINKTGKLHKYIKSWNYLHSIQKTWIALKTHFREAHLELNKTGELTLQQAGYHQANLVEDIVSRLTTTFQHEANMVNIVPPEDPSPPTTTGTADILNQVIAQKQELM